MIKFLSPFLFILMTNFLLAQEEDTDKGFLVGNVMSDTSSFMYPEEIRFGLSPILKSENIIEIRFIEVYFRSFRGVVLTYNTKWESQICKNEVNSMEENWIPANGEIDLDSLFFKLVTNNIFSLPDDNELSLGKLYFNPKTNVFIGEGFGIGCGGSSIIEFKIGDMYRTYSFGSAESFSAFYPSVPEFKNYVNIEMLFNQLLR